MSKYFNKKDVEKNNYTIIDNKVYDLKNFHDHPGGYDIIKKYFGKDATQAFKNVNHSKSAINMMNEFFIGFYAK